MHIKHRQSCFVSIAIRRSDSSLACWLGSWTLLNTSVCWLLSPLDCALAFIKEVSPALLGLSQTTSQSKQRDILITTGNVIPKAAQTSLYCHVCSVWPMHVFVCANV